MASQRAKELERLITKLSGAGAVGPPPPTLTVTRTDGEMDLTIVSSVTSRPRKA
jgi:hypothetical protein